MVKPTVLETRRNASSYFVGNVPSRTRSNSFDLRVSQFASDAISLPKPMTDCFTLANFSACQM